MFLRHSAGRDARLPTEYGRGKNAVFDRWRPSRKKYQRGQDDEEVREARRFRGRPSEKANWLGGGYQSEKLSPSSYDISAAEGGVGASLCHRTPRFPPATARFP